ncbi:MAG: hypothetical protein PHD13_02305 [Methanocellales archaeon]|nr:hypothetical protein [Methanocellales archaeon]MDD3291106.1 hypothetical protein [Methanocellales archaeon]MDD5234991.1 hypothetical protein [Methanocellales archaeon]MDD5484638.1 hypothetical protein [Methanocellales archaeon]
MGVSEDETIGIFLEERFVNYNFIRPHQALNDETSAETCGIEIEGKNKWITLIQNASKRNNVDIS